MKSTYLLIFILFVFLRTGNAGNKFPADGDVGIGTTNPQSELDVRGKIRLGGVASELGSLANTDRGIVFFSRGASNSALNGAHDAGRIYGTNTHFDTHGNGGGWPNQALVLQAGNTWDGYVESQLVLKGNGRIGIGTDNPLAKLHVNAGNTMGKAFIFQGNSNTGAVNLTLTTTSGAFPLFQLDHQSRNSVWNIENGRYDDDSLTFYKGGSGTKLIINGSGNVGIGTTTPTNKLDVNGTIRAKEVIVETNWSDFVFENDYELRSLAEVSTFISEHGHLPDVPSAETVQSQGLSVGESQAIMMQKIEELTLYTLEQEAQLTSQNELLEQLLKQNNELITRLEKAGI